MSSSKLNPRRRHAGFTLSEMMIGLGLGGLVVTVVAAMFLYSGVTFATLANYTEMDSHTLNAMSRITRDIRAANGTTAISSNSITVTTDSGGPITYAYASNTRTLNRTQDGTTTTILRDCDSAKFITFQRTPVAGQFTQYEPGDTNEAKVFFVTWSCSRTIFGRKLTTDSASAGRVVMRVN